MQNQPLFCYKCKKEIAYHYPRNIFEAREKTNILLLCVNCYKKINNIPISRKGRRGKTGIRKDIHETYCFKSTLEANFARILNHLKVKWKYENIKYKFVDYKTTPYSYKPDFEIFTETEESLKYGLKIGVYEIKGKIDNATLKKLKRLKEGYPEEYKRLTVVSMSKARLPNLEKLGYSFIPYTDLKKTFHTAIPTWE